MTFGVIFQSAYRCVFTQMTRLLFKNTIAMDGNGVAIVSAERHICRQAAEGGNEIRPVLFGVNRIF